MNVFYCSYDLCLESDVLLLISSGSEVSSEVFTKEWLDLHLIF